MFILAVSVGFVVVVVSRCGPLVSLSGDVRTYLLCRRKRDTREISGTIQKLYAPRIK